MVRRGYVVGSLVAVVLLVTVVLSSTASAPLFGGSHPFHGTQAPPTEGPPDRSSPAVGTDGGLFPHWVLVGATVLLLLYALSLLLLIVFHRRGRLASEAPSDVGAEDDPDDIAWQALLGVELAAAAEEQLTDIELGAARDAIIACWLRLHAATRQVGLEPLVSETPQEFTERMLRRMRVDEAALGRLAALYREARFSDHPMTDVQRRQAADALAVLAAQLSGRQVPA